MKTRHLIFFLPLLLLLQSSCEEQEPQLLLEETINASNPVVQHILSFGIALDDIQEYDDFYLAEGDLRFYKTMLLPSEDLQKAHYRSEYIVSPGNRQISVYIDQSSFNLNIMDIQHGAVDIKPILSSSLSQAMTAYNDLNTDIQFTQVASPMGADIVIQKVDSYFEGGACGHAGFPTADGKAYPTIQIFPLPINNSVGRLAQTLVHELGHTIGLRHTDGANESGSPILIPDTFGQDLSSVMNSGGCGYNFTVFSTMDIYAISCLYSTDPNSPCAPVSTGCVAPAAPASISISTDGQNYLHATAFFSRSFGIPDGYQWDVLGGYINGGYNTNQLSVVPYCDDPNTPGRTIYIAVRVYNWENGVKCYSDWKSISYVHSGTCYLIFN